MNEDFRYMAAIAEHGSISKAARVMHISQPALSQRLKRIESRMGTELFDRSATPLRPTASGEVFMRYALRAIAAEDAMLREVSSIACEQKRRLRIGIAMARANAL
ncbi:MAG: LysR family transcriptional regulator, partial [Eggerthellaceae bacterium]|nr:LysR family transcriptional regulator [Eggerthellaceae bacterium]